MAYTINQTDGSIFATVADGTIDTTSSITIVGRNFAGYGEFLGENFIKLLENGANTSAPGSPVEGELWFNSSNTSTVSNVSPNSMGVYNGAGFKELAGMKVEASTPTTSLVAGLLWFDTTNEQLNVYNGTGFTIIGPTTTAGVGTSGVVIDTIDGNIVLELVLEDEIIATVYDGASFIPSTPPGGGTVGEFPTIEPGIQLNATLNSGSTALFQGKATNSAGIDDAGAPGTVLDSTTFVRTDTTSAQVIESKLTISNDLGLVVGDDSDFNVTISVGGDITISNDTSSGDVFFVANDAGSTPTTLITLDGDLAEAQVPDPTGKSTAAIATKGYVDSTVAAGTAVTLETSSPDTHFVTFTKAESGSAALLVDTTSTGLMYEPESETLTTTRFNGLASMAEYADLAERFEADDIYTAGTVVELGGICEITEAIDELTDNVFGVISTRAAYLMNSSAGGDETHPAVAMNGRVPVKVIGKVKKGDRLVSAGNGLARAATSDEITAFNVIGRSLEDKHSNDEGTVEAIVKVN
jgi:hypothetical protein